MEPVLSIEQIKELSKEMKIDTPSTVVLEKEKALLFLFKTDDVKKVEAIKDNKLLSLEISYSKDMNMFVIFIAPLNKMRSYTAEEYEEHGVCGVVHVDDEKEMEIFKELSKGQATSQIYVFDKDFKCISGKTILDSELAPTLINRELKKLEK